MGNEWNDWLVGATYNVDEGFCGGQLKGDKPDGGYVYRVRMNREIETIGGRGGTGASDIFYIGMSTGGKNDRLGALSKGTHSVCRALNRAAVGGYTGAYVVRWLDSEQPELDEVAELNRFVRKHGQLPIGNATWEGWLGGRVLKHLRDKLTNKHKTPLRFRTAVDAPAIAGRKERFTYIELWGEPVGAWKWLGCLVWAWPSEWCGLPEEGSNAPESKSAFRGGHLYLLAQPKEGAKGDQLPDWMSDARKCNRAERVVWRSDECLDWIGGHLPQEDAVDKGLLGLPGLVEAVGQALTQTEPITPDTPAE